MMRPACVLPHRFHELMCFAALAVCLQENGAGDAAQEEGELRGEADMDRGD